MLLKFIKLHLKYHFKTFFNFLIYVGLFVTLYFDAFFVENEHLKKSSNKDIKPLKPKRLSQSQYFEHAQKEKLPA